MTDDHRPRMFDDRRRRELHQQRVLVLDGALDDDNGLVLATQLMGLATEDPTTDIALWIHSPGGSVPAMLANTPLRGESTGYPTQKPLKLLDRIVRASSTEGSTVLDPFSGSGTTLEAAALLGRKAIGSDIGALAIETIEKRLRGAKIPLQIR